MHSTDLPPSPDISEIAAPYARNLLLEARPQFAKLGSELRARAARQNRAVVNLFRGPNLIEGAGGCCGGSRVVLRDLLTLLY